MRTDKRICAHSAARQEGKKIRTTSLVSTYENMIREPSSGLSLLLISLNLVGITHSSSKSRAKVRPKFNGNKYRSAENIVVDDISQKESVNSFL